MAKNTWYKMVYPERAYEWIRQYVVGGGFEYINKKYNPIILRIMEDYLRESGDINDRERKLYDLYIVKGVNQAEIAVEFGVSYERIRQLLAKLGRKLRARKPVREIHEKYDLMVDPDEIRYNEELDHYTQDIYMSEWDIEVCCKLQGYILNRINEYLYPERQMRHPSISDILDIMEDRHITMEEMFNDIDENMAEMLNWYFAENPYRTEDYEKDEPATILYLDYAEVLRNRKLVLPKGKKKSNRRRKTAEPYKTGYYYGETYIGPSTVPIQRGIPNMYFYKDVTYPSNVIWFLRDAKVINTIDWRETKLTEKESAANFMGYVYRKIKGEKAACAFTQFFMHNDDSLIAEIDLYSLFCEVRKDRDIVRPLVLGETAAARGQFMLECDTTYKDNYEKHIDTFMSGVKRTKYIDEFFRFHGGIRLVDDFTCQIINGDITTASFGNDEESVRIINTLISTVPFINYDAGGFDKSKFKCYNIKIPHLKLAKRDRISKKNIDELVNDKSINADKLDATPLTMEDAVVYDLKVFENETEYYKIINNAEIKTVGNLIRAVMKNYDFCGETGVSMETARRIFIYVAYLESEVTVIKPKKELKYDLLGI